MPSLDAQTASANRRANVPLVEIKNKKLVFKQKPITFDKLSETMQDIVKFRSMLSELLESKAQPLKEVPSEHLPVVAKLVHESDKTGSALVKHLQKQLTPSDDTIEDADSGSSAPAAALLPSTVIEAAISDMATRVNYGLDNPATGFKIPAGFCVWRWEVKPERRDWLPKSVKDKVEARILERAQAKKDLAALFEALPQGTRDEILKIKSVPKDPLQDQDNDGVITASASTHDTPKPKGAHSPVKAPPKRPADDDEDAVDGQSDSPTKLRGRPKNPETLQKEREKQERKAAKEEKERKVKEATSKSRNIMANFFGKPKAGPSTAPIASSALTLPRRDTYEDMPRKVVEDEFSKTFRPFVVKKDAELAPVNWFLERRTAKGKGKGKEVIVLDGDDTGDVVLAQDDEGSMKEEEMTDVMPVQQSLEFVPDRERLQGLLKSMPPLVGGSRPRVSNDSIRSILGLLSDAEVNGDTALVRTCLDRLSDRTAFPAKVLVFPGDSRPGYLGTHTKVSSVIRPRAPFNQDTVALDYSCDSGEEWEGEEEGAGDDVADDDEDGPDAGDDDDDSDADSWLVDDDSVDNVTLPDLDRASPFSDISLGGMSIDMRAVSPTLSLKKRKGAQVEEKPKGDKKRKVVVPLIPYTKGPYWETEVGVCEYAPFEEYRIRLFNDTPFGVDPFTFVSTATEDMKAAKHAATADDGAFAVPVLPDHAVDGPTPAPSTSASDAVKPRAAPKPKSSFPEALVPTLLAKIKELATGSLVLIVEAAYRDLKAQKVKKNTLEAKIREVSEKAGSPKVWTVKPEVQAQYSGQGP